MWTAAQTGEGIPDLFEAATLTDTLDILREEEIDAVLSDGTFPRAWGNGMRPVISPSKKFDVVYTCRFALSALPTDTGDKLLWKGRARSPNI